MSLVPGGNSGFYPTFALLDGATYRVAAALRL